MDFWGTGESYVLSKHITFTSIHLSRYGFKSNLVNFFFDISINWRLSNVKVLREPEFSQMEQLRNQLIESWLPRPLSPSVPNTIWVYLPWHSFQDFLERQLNRCRFWIHRNQNKRFGVLEMISSHKTPANWGLYIQKCILVKVFGKWGLTRLQTKNSTFIIWFVVDLESKIPNFDDQLQIFP